MQTFSVTFRMNVDWVEPIVIAAHNEVAAIPVAKRWLAERCGKVAVRNAQLESVVAVSG